MSTYYTYNSNFLRDRNKFTSTVNTTYGNRRYFSSLDTEVYFGSKQIDEIVAIDFTISEPKLPIYGFNSFYANRIVSGRRTIQGTFAINFTHTLDLIQVLSSIDDSVLKASYPISGGQSLDYESLTYRCEGDDSTGLGIGNNALFSKVFDITISYGYAKTEGMQTYNCSYQTLVGVQIVDYRQALDTEGNPILDMYSFIAKDLRYPEAINKETEENNLNNSSDLSNTSNSNGSSTPIAEEQEYITANEGNPNELAELEKRCKNSSIAGFKINPTFNYSPPGSHAASAYPYLCLYIDGINNETDKFTDVIVTINNESVGIPLKDIKKGGFSLHEFKGSTRNLGITLRKNYIEDENYVAVCDIEFVAKIRGKNVVVKIPKTPLNRGKTY